MLSLDDSELNQVVGIKRLAPYREEGGARGAKPNYKALQALKDKGALMATRGRAGGGAGCVCGEGTFTAGHDY